MNRRPALVQNQDRGTAPFLPPDRVSMSEVCGMSALAGGDSFETMIAVIKRQLARINPARSY